MSSGAVVIDLAADAGGNCELTRSGEVVAVGGVHVVGMANPPSGMPTHASFLYARNVANLVGLIVKDGASRRTCTDEIVSGTCVLRQGAAITARRPSSSAAGGRRASMDGHVGLDPGRREAASAKSAT